ncbi:thioredoxin-like protein [Chaetomium sp. MPI-CAGE-AT-0009]|nr:thioredoxin-like protein [Chaetomium sp. MPI-CAGE-AT-0009]
MTVHEIKSAGQFHEIIAAYPLVAIDAWATWCGPCRLISPMFEKHSENLEEKIYFAKIDVDEVQDLAQELGIRAMPTFLFYANGEKVDELVGANPAELEAKVVRLSE